MDGLNISEAIALHHQFISQAREDQAIDTLRAAKATHGFDAGLYEAEWTLLNRLDRLDEMPPVFGPLLEANPQNTSGYVAKCWYLLKKGDLETCEATARDIMRRFPDIYEGYFFASHCQKALGWKDQVLETYVALAANLPGRPEGWTGQAESLIERGDIASAKAALRQGSEGVERDRDDLVNRYVLAALMDGQSLHNVSQEVLDDIVQIAGGSAATAAFLVSSLRGRAPAETRRRILADYKGRFLDSPELVEETVREDFAADDLGAASVSLVRLKSLVGPWDKRTAYVWAEYLVRSGRWSDLALHLDQHSAFFESCAEDVYRSQFVFNAIWLCARHGVETTLRYDDMPYVDGRLRRAAAAFRSGDLLDVCDDPLPRWRERGKPPRFLRIHSFAHSSWMPTVERADASALEDFILDAFFQSRPFSMIRLADCEGHFLDRNHPSLSGATSRIEHHQIVVPRVVGQAYEDLRDHFVAALREADVLGLSNEFSAQLNPPGMLCVRYVAEEAPAYRGAFTDHAAHNALGNSGFLERIVALQSLAGRAVYYIGPHRPSDFALRTIASVKINHIRIPPQVTFFADKIEPEAHYPEYFFRVQEAIATIPAKSLVLVSAGLLGKIYCGFAKAAGAFALDIGAVSDHWCGFQTRISSQHDAKFSSGKRAIEDLIP